MSEVAWFAVAFIGFFVLRFVAATVFFLLLLPEGDRCINCDAPTLRVQGRGVVRYMPWFRSSWCLACGWHGLLRMPERAPASTGDRFPPPRPVGGRPVV